jgi:threonine dehydratase
MISLDEVRTATARIAGRIRRTPVAELDGRVYGLDGPIWFKLEFLQHTGSFKVRGMVNRIVAAQERGEIPPAGVVAASGGNAGLAVAYAARELGVPAEVFVPTTAPAVKVAKIAKLGARVVQVGSEYAEAYAAATARSDALFCHAYDQADVVAGHGSLGIELTEQISGGFDTVLVAVGGGGLMAGVASALNGSARVVAVEPENSPTLHEALLAGRPVDVAVSGIAADSLGARRVGEIAYDTAVAARVTSVLVADQAIVSARRHLWNEYQIAVEHGTAAALAALMSGGHPPAPGERVVVLLCGANTDLGDLA